MHTVVRNDQSELLNTERVTEEKEMKIFIEIQNKLDTRW